MIKILMGNSGHNSHACLIFIKIIFRLSRIFKKNDDFRGERPYSAGRGSLVLMNDVHNVFVSLWAINVHFYMYYYHI